MHSGRQRKSSPIVGCTALSCDELKSGRTVSDSHLRYAARVKCDGGCDCRGNARQSAAMTRVSPIGLWRRNFPSNRKFAAAAVAPACPALPGNGAGDGNRTHVSSLGSCSSTIELHPRPWGRIVRKGRFARQSASSGVRRVSGSIWSGRIPRGDTNAGAPYDSNLFSAGVPFPIRESGRCPAFGHRELPAKNSFDIQTIVLRNAPQIAQKPEAKPGASVTLTKEAGARACGSEPNRVHVGKDLA